MQTWIVYAVLSMIFAGLTSVLAKYGLKNIHPDLGLGIRTTVIFFLITLINVVGSKSSQNSKLANDHISLNLRSKDDIPEEIVVAFKSDIMESIGFVVLCLMIVIGVGFCIMSELTLSVTVFIILSVLSGLIAFTMKLLEGKHYYIFSVFFSFIGLAIYRVHGNSVLCGLAITFLLITSFWNKGSELLRKSLPDPPIEIAEKDTLPRVEKSEDQVFSKLFGNR